MRKKKNLESKKISKFSISTDKFVDEFEESQKDKKSKLKKGYKIIRIFKDTYESICSSNYKFRKSRFVTEVETSSTKRFVNRKKIDSDKKRIRKVYKFVEEEYGKKYWKDYIVYSIKKWKDSEYANSTSYLIGFMESKKYQKGFIPKRKVSSRDEHKENWNF